MKRYLHIFILLWAVSTTHGAHFSYYAGGYSAACQVYAEDYGWYDGPYTGFSSGTTEAGSTQTAMVPEARAYASEIIDTLFTSQNDSVWIHVKCDYRASADDSWGYAYGYGLANTSDAATYGVFYKIQPDAGESVGDDVTVYHNCTIRSATTSPANAFVDISGPNDMDHVAITLNQLPPVTTEPNSANEIWTIPHFWFSNGRFQDFGIGTFPAQIGDVIGVFAEVHADIEIVGPSNEEIRSTFSLVLSVESTIKGDLDGDGDVDFYDFSEFADNWLESTE